MIRIALIRHAETEWNAARRIQGQADSPLTAAGREAAVRWISTLAPLAFHAMFASPLGRAMTTADILGHGLGLSPVPLDGVREQAFGEWTGRNVEELREQGLLARLEPLGWAFTPPGGEDRRTVLARSWDALLIMARNHSECQSEDPQTGRSAESRLLVVTHEGVIRAILYALCGRDYLPTEPKILAPRALHWLRAENGCLRLEAMNLPL